MANEERRTERLEEFYREFRDKFPHHVLINLTRSIKIDALKHALLSKGIIKDKDIELGEVIAIDELSNILRHQTPRDIGSL